MENVSRFQMANDLDFLFALTKREAQKKRGGGPAGLEKEGAENP